MKLLVRPGHADIAAQVAPELVTVGQYIGITVDLPDRIASRLPVAHRGVRPHITIAGAEQVTVDQVRRLRAAFDRRAYSVSLAQLKPFRVVLRGSGDFRNEEEPTDVVYLQVAEGADQLAGLAVAFDAEFNLPRRFKRYRPHVTLAANVPGAQLDQVAAQFRDFEDEFMVPRLTFTPAHGKLTEPRDIKWHEPHHFSLT